MNFVCTYIRENEKYLCSTSEIRIKKQFSHEVKIAYLRTSSYENNYIMITQIHPSLFEKTLRTIH